MAGGIGSVGRLGSGVGEVTEYDEYALRVNCEKQGCDPVHGNDGEILENQSEWRKEHRMVMGHACDLLVRQVTITDWKLVSEEE